MEQSRSDHFVPGIPSLSAEGADYLRRFILDRHKHIHRRVETITCLDDGTTRRRVSVDITLPEGRPADVTAIPIAVLVKRPIKSLDVRDACGTALATLTTEQNAALATSILASHLGYGHWSGSELLTRIVTTRQLVLADVFLFVDNLPDSRSEEENLAALDLAMRLRTTFLFFVVLDPEPRRDQTRMLLKFSYEEPLKLQGLVRPRPVLTAVSADWANVFHLEVRSPQSTVIEELSLRKVIDADDDDDGGDAKSAAVAEGEQSDTDGGRVAHVYVRQDPRSDDTSYTGAFRFLAEPSGLPIASVITSSLTAAAFLAVAFSQSLWLAVVGVETAPDGLGGVVVPVVLLGPAVFVAFLAQTPSHAVAARLLRVPRGVLGVSAVVLVFGAIVTARLLPQSMLRPIWLVLTALASAAFVAGSIWFLGSTSGRFARWFRFHAAQIRARGQDLAAWFG